MMKRLTALILLSLILSGCAGTAPSVSPEQNPSVLSGTVLGAEAIRYPLPAGKIVLHSIGEDLVLVAETESGMQLIRYNGKDMSESARGEFPEGRCDTLRVSTECISFFNGKETCVLDDHFLETARIAVPDGCTDPPLLSDDGKHLYYSKGSALWELDTASGRSRILREVTGSGLRLLELTADGSVLICQTSGETEQILGISTKSGAVMRNAHSLLHAVSCKDMLYRHQLYGDIDCLLFGTDPESPNMLPLPSGFRLVDFLPTRNQAVIRNAQGIGLMDLNNGECTAFWETNITVTSAMEASADKVWLTASDGTENALLLWDTQASPPGNVCGCVTPFYSAEKPDTAGLAACQAKAQALTKQFGIPILLWKDAVRTEPWDYRFTPEYLVPVLDDSLNLLEQQLARFPEGFLSTLAGNAAQMTICIVRSIEGLAANQSLEIASGLQFWDGADSYLVICTGSGAERALYHELCHMIDTQVMNHSDAYDTWDQLNPEGFSYDLDYGANRERTETEYLQPGRQSFVDTYSMSYPREDRARILECAMTEGHEDLFRSPVLQAKLNRICTGIREAFSLKEYHSKLPWEEYLWDALY